MQRQSAISHQQLEELRQEVAGLQPLYSPTAPQDSDLWKLQIEVGLFKSSQPTLIKHTHKCTQASASNNANFILYGQKICEFNFCQEIILITNFLLIVVMNKVLDWYNL